MNQWRRRDERAPHKPLLLLYMIGRLQQTGTASVAYSEAKPALKQLLADFGPPRDTTPAYPFHYLTTDGLWVVKGPHGEASPGAKSRELEAGYRGELEGEFAQALERDPRLLNEIVLALLNKQFPSSLHEDILGATGIELGAELASRARPAIDSHRRRDPAFREMVLTAYEYRCAACGYEGSLGRDSVGLEAAHVKWWAAHGPDEVSNGLALCSLHHKLLDRGAIGISDELTVLVSQHFFGNGEAAGQVVMALVDRPMARPQGGNEPPASAHVRWHREQVFRRPARVLASGAGR